MEALSCGSVSQPLCEATEGNGLDYPVGGINPMQCAARARPWPAPSPTAALCIGHNCITMERHVRPAGFRLVRQV